MVDHFLTGDYVTNNQITKDLDSLILNGEMNQHGFALLC